MAGPKNRSRGFVLGASVILLLVLVIFTPVLIRLIRQNTTQTVSRIRSDTALSLAEAGIAKAIWKLQEPTGVWTTVCTGTVVTGYNDDTEYTDMAGGVYKVRMVADVQPQQVKITAKGKDTAGGIRAIEAVYGLPKAAFIKTGQDMNYGTTDLTNMTCVVHWGLIQSYARILLTSYDPANYVFNPSFYFPRKYASNAVTVRDADFNPPNSDNTEYWAFQNLGDPPQLDTNYYKTKALSSSIPTSSGGQLKKSGGLAAVASPAGSGYFKGSLNGSFIWANGYGTNYVFRNSTSVIYLDDDNNYGLTFELDPGSLIDVEAVILKGPLSYMNAPANSATVYATFGATIPVDAPLEYQSPNGSPTPAAVWASTGAPGTYSANSFSAIYSGGTRCCYSLPHVRLHGFLYVEGTLALNNGVYTRLPQIVGVVWTGGTMGYDSYVVLYDDKVGEKIRYLKPLSLNRLSWKEVNASW